MLIEWTKLNFKNFEKYCWEIPEMYVDPWYYTSPSVHKILSWIVNSCIIYNTNKWPTK